MTSRKRLTKYEFAVMFLEQKGLCGCGCGERLEAGQVDEEHGIPDYFRKDDPNYDGKPDSLWRRECHRKRKTPKDRKDIAKSERIIRKNAGTFNVNRKKIQNRNTLSKEHRKAVLAKFEGIE